MYTKRIIIVILILAMGLTMYGCGAIDTMKNLISEDEDNIEIVRSGEEDEEFTDESNMRDTVLYFQNESGYLVPVKRQLPWEEGIAKAALSNMVASPMIDEDIGAIGLSAILPAGTEILGMSINAETGLCKVDFTVDATNYNSKMEEENLVRGVVYTLTEFPAISEVQFMFNGETVSELKYGTNVSKPIKREDINTVETSAMGTSKVVIYYKGTSNGEYEYYVPVTVPTSAPIANVLTALEELFKGAPDVSGLYTDIPAGVELLGVEVSNGIAYVDIAVDSKKTLSEQITFDRMTKNIALTLKEFSEIDDIEILIDGKDIDDAGLKVKDLDIMPVFANEY